MIYTIESVKLETIRHIESQNCLQINHNSDAIGCYGLRPITIKQLGYEFKINKLKNNPLHSLHNDVAIRNMKYIQQISKCYTDECLAYGWLNGPFGLKKVLIDYNYGKIPYRNPLKNHWYVKRFNKSKLLVVSNRNRIIEDTLKLTY